MSFNYVEKAKGFIISPGESFRQSREDELSDAIRYFSVILTIFAALSGLIAGIDQGVGDGVTLSIVLFITSFVGLFICGVALYISLIIISGKKEGFDQALKVIIYSSTPGMLLGWFPVVNIIGDLWAMIILILGIGDLWISTGRKVVSIGRTVMFLFFSFINGTGIIILLLMPFVAPTALSGDHMLDYFLFFIFLAALLAVFDAGAYIFCKSESEPSVSQQSTSSSVPVSSQSQQKRSKKGDLILCFDRAMMKSWERTSTSEEIKAELQGMRSPSSSVPGSSPSQHKHSKEDDPSFERVSMVSSQRTNTLEEIETGLQKMKATHPAWMGRPEFAPLVMGIEENQADLSKYDETERLYKQLKSQVESLEESVLDLDRLRK